MSEAIKENLVDENIVEEKDDEEETKELYVDPAFANEDVIIEFKNVVKKYKLFKNEKQRLLHVFSNKVKYTEKLAIDHLSFQIRRGEAVAFIGQNGAGKSTLLKMITEVSYPTEGEIIVNGRVSALLELTAGFDPELSGRGNIYIKGQIMGMEKEEIAALEPAIVEFADIGEYIDQPVRTYSSGMKSRLGFGINVNIMPEILIVDEALSVGDRSFRGKCIDKIHELLDDKVTFLLVTHSTGTAKDFCTRGIVMQSGRSIFDGPVEDAVAYYEDKIAPKIKRKKKRKRIF